MRSSFLIFRSYITNTNKYIHKDTCQQRGMIPSGYSSPRMYLSVAQESVTMSFVLQKKRVKPCVYLKIQFVELKSSI